MRFGPAAVWRAGLLALGFPPTWAMAEGEVAVIVTKLGEMR